MELEMYRRYSQMARGIEKAELVFKNGRVFSSGTGEFIDGDVAVADSLSACSFQAYSIFQSS